MTTISIEDAQAKLPETHRRAFQGRRGVGHHTGRSGRCPARRANVWSEPWERLGFPWLWPRGMLTRSWRMMTNTSKDFAEYMP